jgi:hypothetical protein
MRKRFNMTKNVTTSCISLLLHAKTIIVPRSDVCGKVQSKNKAPVLVFGFAYPQFHDPPESILTTLSTHLCNPPLMSALLQ